MRERERERVRERDRERKRERERRERCWEKLYNLEPLYIALLYPCKISVSVTFAASFFLTYFCNSFSLFLFSFPSV